MKNDNASKCTVPCMQAGESQSIVQYDSSTSNRMKHLTALHNDKVLDMFYLKNVEHSMSKTSSQHMSGVDVAYDSSVLV